MIKQKLLIGAASVIASFGMLGGLAAAQTTVSDTGPNSNNQVTNSNSVKVHINNDTHISVSNSTSQSSTSGDATVSHNTTGGGATTGNASSSNSTSTTLDVTN